MMISVRQVSGSQSVDQRLLSSITLDQIYSGSIDGGNEVGVDDPMERVFPKMAQPKQRIPGDSAMLSYVVER